MPKSNASPPRRARTLLTLVAVIAAMTTTGARQRITEISPLDYGAKCDGAADDSRALQRALDAAAAVPAGTLVLPPRTCVFKTGLIVGGAKGGSYSHVNIRGVSEDVSRLSFAGPDAGADVALFIKHVGFFRMESFAVEGPLHAKKHAGKTVGIKLGDNGGTGGTQTVQGTFNHVAVSGFHIGMIAGDSDAASEIDCYRCRFSGNAIGWTASGYNSLNFLFYGVDLSNNGIGMAMGGPQVTDGPKIYGGAASQNDVDFSFGNTFGPTLIHGIRSETAGLFIKGGAAQLTVDSCVVTASVNDDGRLIDLTAGQLSIRNSTLFGSIRYVINDSSGSVIIENSQIRGADAWEPVVYGRPDSGVGGISYRYFNNVRLPADNGAPANYPDAEGIVTMVDGKATVLPRVSELRDASGRETFGVGLNGVRAIGAAPLTAGRNVRDSVTFAGASTAEFAFRRTLVVNVDARQVMTATSGTFSAADAGKRVVLAQAASDCGYARGPATGDIVGFVGAVLDGTRAVAYPARPLINDNCRPNFSARTGITATLGEDEPDAHYLVVGLACNADERFSWSAITAAGFTVTSSNPRSTATCNFMIVR